MPDQPNIPAGQPLPPPTPEERSIMLAKIGSRDDLLIVTQAEFAGLNNAILAFQKANLGNRALFNALSGMLGFYWISEPDIVNAVGAVFFDAERFKKGVELVNPALKKTKEKLDKLIEAQAGPLGVVIGSDLLTISQELGERIKFLDKQESLRRERIKPTVPKN